MKTLFAVAAATFVLAGTANAQTRDSRGQVVESQQATAPDGTNIVPTIPEGARVTYAPNQEAVFATRPATQEYTACRPGQTDRCIQTYEVRQPRRRR